MYPIVFSHHTLSYPGDLHRSYVPLILSDTAGCDSFVCTSRAAKSMACSQLERTTELLKQHGLTSTFKGRFDVLPLGVDCNRFYPRPQRACRSRFGISHKELIVLYLGRLSAIDKADLFPLALAIQQVKLRNPHMKVKLLIAGQSYGDYAQVLFRGLRAAGLERNVIFMPRVTEEEKPTLFCAADLFVSPVDNLQECFGQSVIEAMASDIPQLVSDWDGYRDLVVHDKTGFLVPTLWGNCDSDLAAAAEIFPREWHSNHYLMA